MKLNGGNTHSEALETEKDPANKPGPGIEDKNKDKDKEEFKNKDTKVQVTEDQPQLNSTELTKQEDKNMEFAEIPEE